MFQYLTYYCIPGNLCSKDDSKDNDKFLDINNNNNVPTRQTINNKPQPQPQQTNNTTATRGNLSYTEVHNNNESPSNRRVNNNTVNPSTISNSTVADSAVTSPIPIEQQLSRINNLQTIDLNSNSQTTASSNKATGQPQSNIAATNNTVQPTTTDQQQDSTATDKYDSAPTTRPSSNPQQHTHSLEKTIQPNNATNDEAAYKSRHNKKDDIKHQIKQVANDNDVKEYFNDKQNELNDIKQQNQQIKRDQTQANAHPAANDNKDTTVLQKQHQHQHQQPQINTEDNALTNTVTQSDNNRPSKSPLASDIQSSTLSMATHAAAPVTTSSTPVPLSVQSTSSTWSRQCRVCKQTYTDKSQFSASQIKNYPADPACKSCVARIDAANKGERV